MLWPYLTISLTQEQILASAPTPPPPHPHSAFFSLPCPVLSVLRFLYTELFPHFSFENPQVFKSYLPQEASRLLYQARWVRFSRPQPHQDPPSTHNQFGILSLEPLSFMFVSLMNVHSVFLSWLFPESNPGRTLCLYFSYLCGST